MEPQSEDSPLSELNPVQKQTQLRSIYAAVPETSSIAKEQKGPGHFTFNIPNDGITPEEKNARFFESVNKFFQNSVTQKELPSIKFKQLQKLLTEAKVTPILKEKIEYAFKGAFAFGLTKAKEQETSNSIFSIIGATPNTDMTEGIFSLNPEIRSAIDRQYLQSRIDLIDVYNGYIKESIEQKKEHRIPIFEDALTSLRSDIEREQKEYESLYGEKAL